MPRPFTDISDWEKEGCKMYEAIPWIDDPEIEWIRLVFEKHFKVMHAFALRLVRCFAIGLGKSENFFDPWFKDECSSTFRGIHYKPRGDGN